MANPCCKKRKRKCKKRKKQKKKKRNKERKVVGKEDKIPENKGEQGSSKKPGVFRYDEFAYMFDYGRGNDKDSWSIRVDDGSIGPSTFLSLMGEMPTTVLDTGMQLHDRTEVGERPGFEFRSIRDD